VIDPNPKGKLRYRVNRSLVHVAIVGIVCMTIVLVVAMFLHVITRDDVLRFASYVAVAIAGNSAPSLVHWFRSKPLGDSDPPPPSSPRGGENADSGS